MRCVDVPYTKGVVIGARYHFASIRCDGNASDFVCMSFQNSLNIKPFNCIFSVSQDIGGKNNNTIRTAASIVRWSCSSAVLPCPPYMVGAKSARTTTMIIAECTTPPHKIPQSAYTQNCLTIVEGMALCLRLAHASKVHAPPNAKYRAMARRTRKNYRRGHAATIVEKVDRIDQMGATPSPVIIARCTTSSP